MSKKAILLLNLGTPDHCDTHSVRRYLREFLMDPRVIDLPNILRWPLVNLLIVPFRFKKTTAAYQKIWLQEGSPLLVHTQKMRDALAKFLGNDYQVEFAMRYGNPSITDTMKKLSDVASIHIIPLFPQYSSAATGSAVEKFLETIKTRWNMPALTIERDFYDYPGFITAYVEIIRQHLENNPVEFTLFSYHGLPERHIHKSECQTTCDHLHACPPITNSNRFCYRAQCYATTSAIVKELELTKEKYAVSFQSRLGRTPWIKPYTDVVLPELARKGIKKLAIVCPSFVADCLETLEEVNIRAREQWQSLGGTHFTFIPCLNDSPAWINALAEMVGK